jgi:hypothetical protein
MSLPRSVQSPRLWIPICIFLGLATLVPFVCHWQRRRNEPRSIADLVTRCEAQLSLHPVAASKGGNPSAGVYLCREAGRRREELPAARQREFLSEWRGVVLVVRLTTDSDFALRLKEWGDAAAVVGELLVWGDPALVAEIVRMTSRF